MSRWISASCNWQPDPVISPSPSLLISNWNSPKKAILSLDSDFLGSEENLHVNIRGYARGRKTTTSKDSISRLYAVEALMTLTGANADHRLRIAASAIPAVAARLAVEILGANVLGDEVQALAQSPAIKANEKCGLIVGMRCN